MKRNIPLFVIHSAALFVLLLSGACDTVNQNSYEQSYIVESYLIEGEPLPEIFLSTDQSIDHLYDFNQTAVEFAEVLMHQVDSSDSVIETFEYEMASKGVYMPVNNRKVTGGETYKLEIIIPDDENHRITATSTVPTGFKIEEVLNDSTQYKGPELPSARCTPSFYKDRQAYYVLTILNEIDENRLTPLFADLIDSDDETDIEDFEKLNSGILNEASMLAFGDGDIKVELPWSAVVFFGASDVVFSTIDDNLYDFFTSHAIQLFDGNHISPGEIYDVKYNIEGGIGIFGSYAADTASVYIYP